MSKKVGPRSPARPDILLVFPCSFTTLSPSPPRRLRCTEKSNAQVIILAKSVCVITDRASTNRSRWKNRARRGNGGVGNYRRIWGWCDHDWDGMKMRSGLVGGSDDGERICMVWVQTDRMHGVWLQLLDTTSDDHSFSPISSGASSIPPENVLQVLA
jgi:hypothetical protein